MASSSDIRPSRALLESLESDVPDPANSPPNLGFDLVREIWITRIGLVVTVLASAFVGWEFVWILMERVQTGQTRAAALHVLLMVCVAFLVYGALVYIFTRLGYLKRLAAHRPASREVLDTIYVGVAPPLTILVPAYKEDIRVIRRTLLSAALQDYPNRRVVLLIDDPPSPTSRAQRSRLQAVRHLPMAVQDLLTDGFQRVAEIVFARRKRTSGGAIGNLRQEAQTLADCYREVASWFDEQVGVQHTVIDADRLLVDKMLVEPARAYRKRADELEQQILDSSLTLERVWLEYRRLSSLFKVELTGFERKRYVNLSHKPNKAMNLNSYIAQIGKSFREVTREDGLHLEQVDPLCGNIHIPDASFLINLDADSLLVGDYATRLIHYMRQPGNERVAVAQTPYSTIPGARSIVAQVAGATTDVQYVIHQGFSQYDAAYWVGANAVLRKEALDDIRQVVNERGFEISKYIEDHTPIEDSESTVDLLLRGWSLYNYPERMAYSATPPDFGSLLVQRRRWANGGLIILPKLLRYLVKGPLRRSAVVTGFFRCHYLTSLFTANVALLIILSYPFEQSMRVGWLPVEVAPYFILYTRDLVQAGYRRSDMLRVYAMNLMLIPVVLGGILKSLFQALTRRDVAFSRTPKVHDRTAAPALYIALVFLLLGQWLTVGLWDSLEARWFHAGLCFINASFMAYAIVRFIGLKEATEDLSLPLTESSSWPIQRTGGFDPAIERGSINRPSYVGMSLFDQSLIVARLSQPRSDEPPVTVEPSVRKELSGETDVSGPRALPAPQELSVSTELAVSEGLSVPEQLSPPEALHAPDESSHPEQLSTSLVVAPVQDPYDDTARDEGGVVERRPPDVLVRLEDSPPARRLPLDPKTAALESLQRNLSCGDPTVEVEAARVLLELSPDEEDDSPQEVVWEQVVPEQVVKISSDPGKTVEGLPIDPSGAHFVVAAAGDQSILDGHKRTTPQDVPRVAGSKHGSRNRARDYHLGPDSNYGWRPVRQRKDGLKMRTIRIRPRTKPSETDEDR